VEIEEHQSAGKVRIEVRQLQGALVTRLALSLNLGWLRSKKGVTMSQDELIADNLQ
jgi:hypothetical protein